MASIFPFGDRRGIHWQLDNTMLRYLAYADDICLLPPKLFDLQAMTTTLHLQLRLTRLNMNVAKTKTLHLDSTTSESLDVDGQQFECVQKFFLPWEHR